MLLGYFRQKTLTFIGQQHARRISQGRPGGWGGGGAEVEYQNT